MFRRGERCGMCPWCLRAPHPLAGPRWVEGDGWRGPVSQGGGTAALGSPPCSSAALPGSPWMPSKWGAWERSSCESKPALGLSKAQVCAGRNLPPVLVYFLLLTASSRLSPSRAPGKGPRSSQARTVEAKAGSLLQNEVLLPPPRCPAAPW